MKLKAFSLILVLTSTWYLAAQRVVSESNENWLFYYYPVRDRGIKAEVPFFAKLEFDASSWNKVALPHTWSIYETTGQLHPYIKSPGPADDPYWWNGIGVYRKIFTVDNKHKERKFFVEFDGVQKSCRIYINSKYIGQHFGGYGGFYFDLTDYILYDGKENILCVEVSNVQDDSFKVPPTDAGNWNPYGGMTRGARFVITDPVFIPYQGSYKHEGGTFITCENITEKSADVRVRTWIKNENKDRKPVQAKLVTIIRDAQKNEVMCLEESKNIYFMELAEFNAKQTLIEPKLWSPDTPILYTAESQVWVNDKQTDSFYSRFGISDFMWNYGENRLYVNGHKIMLRGFNRHLEYPWLGDAIPEFIHRMDLGRCITLTNEQFGLAKLLRCTVRGWYDDDDNPNRPDNQQWAGNETFHHDVVRDPKYYEKGEQRVDMPNVVIWLFVDHDCDREYKNSPLLHYNPKGWVDSYRVPKYVYYLFQANYAEKPMIFVHPYFWRNQYIGAKKKFTINSNCEEVELFVGNKSRGRRKPNKEGQFVVDSDNILVSNTTLRAVGYRNKKPVTEHLPPMTGNPDALTLKSSHPQIESQLNSVAIVTADIVDAKKNHIYGARNTLKWEVKDPAKLVGPDTYESDFNKSEEFEETLYIDVPVSNVIRSTGEPGDIIVTVSADGIKKAEVIIKALAVSKMNTDIIELIPEKK